MKLEAKRCKQEKKLLVQADKWTKLILELLCGSKLMDRIKRKAFGRTVKYEL